MTRASFKRLLLSAIFASLVGSTIGTALLLIDEMCGHPLRRLMGRHFAISSESISNYILIYPVVWAISLFGTVPGSILIGVPAIYPFRNQIAHRPLLSVIPIVLYAVLLATLLLGWTITPTAFGAKYYDTVWFYSASTALGFVIALSQLSRPL